VFHNSIEIGAAVKRVTHCAERMMVRRTLLALLVLASLTTIAELRTGHAQEPSAHDQMAKTYGLVKLKVGPLDCPQWGGTSLRNNVRTGKNVPLTWTVPSRGNAGQNIKWSVKLGNVSYSSPVVANGKVFIGTNNFGQYLERFPSKLDLGCLLCFDEKDGTFIWQHSNRKLPSGRVHDWPFQGVVSVPLVDGQRLWYVSNRGEIVCLDTEGFHDHENDGSYQDEEAVGKHEADVVWKFDMMAKLGISQHNMCTCSLTCSGDVLFAVTSNGVDESHVNLPSSDAPAFVALDRNTAKVLWTDNSPGQNILHGSWSSPSYAVLGKQPQVLFPGGDCWLYSFDPRGDGNGNSKLLWKFDCNPKTSRWVHGGRGNRNEFISLPVIYDSKVYVATGQDAEHGEGVGHLWCIDPTKKFDGSEVSPELGYGANGKRLPDKRLQAVDPAAGESTRPNPDSALVWHYTGVDLDGNGSIEFEEQMHRSCGNVAIQNDLLFIADFSGLVHCLNARTGQPYWTHDLLAAAWAASPLIVDGKVYIGDEDGDIAIFKLSKKKELLNEVTIGNSVYSTPVFANNVLYIASRTTLFAIATDAD
jgi:outer membrane protein assembly factor BamB